MARQAVADDPLLTKRKKREAIGFMVTVYYCSNCLPSHWGKAAVIDMLREGDDAGEPFTCAACGQALRPTQVES